MSRFTHTVLLISVFCSIITSFPHLRKRSRRELGAQLARRTPSAKRSLSKNMSLRRRSLSRKMSPKRSLQTYEPVTADVGSHPMFYGIHVGESFNLNNSSYMKRLLLLRIYEMDKTLEEVESLARLDEQSLTEQERIDLKAEKEAYKIKMTSSVSNEYNINKFEGLFYKTQINAQTGGENNQQGNFAHEEKVVIRPGQNFL